MSDELTLLRECLACHSTDVTIDRLSAQPLSSVRCGVCGLRTRWDSREIVVAAWQTRVPDPALAAAQEALKASGIGGIYDDFHSLADAITQMATHIKELEARIAVRDGRIAELGATLREAVNTVRAGRRVYLAGYDMHESQVNVLTVERWASVLSSPRKEDV